MLNCVKGMKESPENRNLHERYLELLEKGLRRLEKTMRQLLNFGRQESLKLGNFRVRQLIEECLALMEYRLKNIDLQFDDGFGGSCLLDSEALRQVLVNIILNALEAMPAGGRLTIATRRQEENLVISVADSGEGISREHIRHIFEPFFTTREVGKGTGLGLSVSFALVDRMGGRIEVESEPGRGSRFDIILPIKEAA